MTEQGAGPEGEPPLFSYGLGICNINFDNFRWQKADQPTEPPMLINETNPKPATLPAGGMNAESMLLHRVHRNLYGSMWRKR